MRPIAGFIAGSSVEPLSASNFCGGRQCVMPSNVYMHVQIMFHPEPPWLDAWWCKGFLFCRHGDFPCIAVDRRVRMIRGECAWSLQLK